MKTITQLDHDAVDRFREIARVEFARLGYTPAQYRSRDRHRALAWARAEVAWKLRQWSGPPSLPVIARCIGVSDHTSVINALAGHQARLAAAAKNQIEQPATATPETKEPTP